MDDKAVNQAFQELVQDLDDIPGISVANINQTIWRMNEAAMYLSRHVQYSFLEPGHEIPAEVLILLPTISVMASELSRLLAKGEGGECLECLESEQLGELEDYDGDDDD